MNLQTRRTTVIAAIGLIFVLPVDAPGAGVEVKEKDGHALPVMAEVTYRNGTSKTEMVMEIELNADNFKVQGRTPEGTITEIWLDSISTIEDTEEDRAVFVLKDGQRLRLREPSNVVGYDVHIATPDGGSAEVGLENIKVIRFQQPPRKDADGNAMFDHWRYSPYTGERLPEQ